MVRIILLLGLVCSALAADMPMMSTPSPLPLFNPMKQQQFVSGSTPFVPNLMSNFSSSSNLPASGSGASYFPPGYGIQQVFYPPPVIYNGMGSSDGSYPQFTSNIPPMNQNPSLVRLQGHASPVHQVPWYPTPASTCQGCNLIYRGIPYPGLVPNVQLAPSNVPYVRNVPLESMSPLVHNWVPQNIQPVFQNLPLYSPEPIPSPVQMPSEPVSVVPEAVSVPVVPEPVIPESPVSVNAKEEVPVAVPEVPIANVPVSENPVSRKKRALVLSRSYWPSYGYRSSWPYHGYRSYYGGWSNYGYGYRSYYPVHSRIFG